MEISKINRNLFELKKLIGESKAIREIKAFIKKVAQVDHPVLILGETGVGKTLIAWLIHSLSKRRDKLFFHQNCSNIAETLLESELYGYEKGAFTGATERRIGKIERADRGTLFLDEISDLSFQNQARLLLFLESGKFFRVGGAKEIKTDVRIIAASNKDLYKEMKREKFREDLYYRISTLELYIPALRERKEDIPLLVEAILKEESLKQKREITITRDALNKLQKYSFPGNVRELENIMKRAATFAEDCLIKEENIHFPQKTIKKKKGSKYSMEKIMNVLVKYQGNKTKAAKELGISRGYFYEILNDLKNK
ncbi:MAG: sigma-54 interaction domain-containing protein [Methanosarcinales archaeon]